MGLLYEIINIHYRDIPFATNSTKYLSITMQAVIPWILIVLLCAFACCSPDEYKHRNNTSIPGSCTIFTISKEESVFFGNNEDWFNPLTFYWTEPPREDSYGVLYFGYENLFPQGGINEKGLAYDANSLPKIPAQKHPELLRPSKAIINELIMQKCANVEEAIEMAKSYDWSQCYMGYIDGQFMLADASGDAVVIGSDSNGEIVFTRKELGDGFLVSTNFNLANPENRFGRYPCKRYTTVVRMLNEIKNKDDLTVEYLTSILDKVHEEGKGLNTLFSNIFDLKEKVAYLFYWHQYDYVVKLNVLEEISRNPEPAQIKTLFPQEILEQAEAEHKKHQRRPAIILITFAIIATALGILMRSRRLVQSR